VSESGRNEKVSRESDVEEMETERTITPVVDGATRPQRGDQEKALEAVVGRPDDVKESMVEGGGELGELWRLGRECEEVCSSRRSRGSEWSEEKEGESQTSKVDLFLHHLEQEEKRRGGGSTLLRVISSLSALND
jgi:hypothetical protein